MGKGLHIRKIILTAFAVLLVSACAQNETPPKVPPTTLAKKADAENNSGIVEWQKGNYPAALEHFTKAYKEAKKNKDTYLIATLLNNMGLIHWRMNNNDEAMECYTEAAKIGEKLDAKTLVGLTHTNRSLILKQTNDFKAAFVHNDKAIAIFEKLKDADKLAIVYNNQGQLYRASGKPDAALKYYRLSLENCTKSNDTQRATVWQNIADIYREKGNAEKAFDAAHRALTISIRLDNKVRISEGYSELSLIHEKFNQADSALYYLKQHFDAEMTIVDGSKNEQLYKNQAKLGMEVKNLRIENLQNEHEIANNRLLVLVFGILAFLFIVSFFVYRYFSRMHFKKSQLELELYNTQQIIEIKEQELKTYIIDLSRKNAIISSLQEETAEVSVPVDPTEDEIAELLEQKILTDDDWEVFKTRFKAIYSGFFTRIKESGIQLTEAETRLLVLMRLELNSKDMANILGISPQSVRVCKMRLKKRLPTDKYASVECFLAELTR